MPEVSQRTARDLPARPEAIPLNPKETALIVVDMQNAYATEGGYVSLAGFDLAGVAPAIENVRRAVSACRAAGSKVIFLQNGWDAAYIEAGGPDSPNWRKSNALRTMRTKPELSGQLLSKGGWDYALIDGLTPEPGDILIPKVRYSGFYNTPLNTILRSHGIRNIVVVGIATNVCLETTLRDGFHHEFTCVLLEDAVFHLGPQFIHDATVYNTEKFFGWVTQTATLSDHLSSFQKGH